jgi:diguanylate cyclase (GGDEF)-like protein
MLGMGAVARQVQHHHPPPWHIRWLPDITALVVLVWSAVLTLLDQAVTTNISAYLNACAGTALVLLLPPRRAMGLFTLAWGLLAWGLGLVSTDPATLLTNRVNAATASVLAVMVSVLLWRKYTQTELLQRALADTNQVLKQQQAELETLATRNSLTGLLNRRECLHQAEQECARAQRDHSPLSLLMLDLDHFKTVNDRFGHPAGDAVLKHVAQLMTQSVRQTDRVARFGGEEFVVLLPNTDAASAHVLADKLRSNLAHTPTPWPQTGAGPDIPITTSIGLVCRPAGGTQTLDMLLARADQALYRAKTLGRNRVEEMATLASDDSVINN